MKTIIFFFILFFLGAEFLHAQEIENQMGQEMLEDCASQVPEPTQDPSMKPEYTLGNAMSPGKGFLVGRNKCGSMAISGYMLLRHINQMPADQSFEDHNGVKKEIDPRNDIQLHRILVWLKGFIYDQRLTYTFAFWTVASTEQVAIIGGLNYKFNEHLNLGGGIAGLPGSRTLNGQHPYFLGTDRHMVEEFMRPGFTHGIWANGVVVPKVNYRVMVGNNLSQLGVNAKQLTRDYAYGGTLWWLPTTGEFGPKEGLGDYEFHSKLATKVGLSYTASREDRFNQPDITEPENTQIRLSDSTLFFDQDAFGQGVVINKADFQVIAFDAAFKYRGVFFMAEYFHRRLDHFSAIGNPYQGNVVDRGIQLQASFFLKPQKWETYFSTSSLWGEFNNSTEFSIGNNYYPFKTRNFRLNALVNFVNKSPAESLFGYYVGGQTGTTVVLATDVFF